jgi:hypothetical protein
MNPIPLNPETERVARRIIWFETPAEALADPVRFMAYAMSHALHEDMKVIRRYVSDEDFRNALDRAPPGIINPPFLGLLEFQIWPFSIASAA